MGNEGCTCLSFAEEFFDVVWWDMEFVKKDIFGMGVETTPMPKDESIRSADLPSFSTKEGE